MKFALCSLLLSALSATASHDGVTYSVHGSGTTNPKKCYWSVMEKLQARSRHPIRLTYRAVGSTTGQVEFVNNGETESVIDFGSGDIPLTADNYNQADGEVIHLPVLLGAVSFFHSVEDANGMTVPKLNLTACALAKIYTGEITQWTHSDIKALNPNLNLPNNGNGITVARRNSGSSSTESVTKYLRKSCPISYPEELANSLPDWPAKPTIGCTGSGGMTTCIRNLVGTIGYIDAGHGISAGLTEVELMNEAKTVQSSQEAAANKGIEAAEGDALPTNPTDDFSLVSLLDQPGQFTWPIVQMTFIYVKKDISALHEPNEQSLLVAFLKSLYNDDYSSPCYDEFGFTRVSEATKQYALDAIDSMILNENATEWIFEGEDTLKITGADDFVISKKRNNFLAVSTDSLILEAEDMQEKIMLINAQLADSGEDILKVQAGLKDAEAAVSREYTDTDDMQLKAALTLGSISFVLWIMSAMAWVVSVCRKKGGRDKSNAVNSII